jgi:hypothetical protein
VESDTPQAGGYLRGDNDGKDGDTGDASDEVTQRLLLSQKLAIRRRRRKEVYEQLDPEEALRRARISAANTGRSPWNKGRRHSTGVGSRFLIRRGCALCVCVWMYGVCVCVCVCVCARALAVCTPVGVHVWDMT